MQANPNSNTAQKNKRASALLAVFWLMGTLSVVLVSLAILLKRDSKYLLWEQKNFVALQWAEKGLNIAANPQIEATDPLLKQSHQSGNEGYHAKIKGEGGKININTTLNNPEEQSLLEEIFTRWGMELREAEYLIDALKDWIDADEEIHLNGAENSEYVKLRLPNYPYNRPFYNLEEMSLVIGMNQLIALQPNWKKYFTVWTQGRVDLNEAEQEVLELVLEITPEKAESIIALRNGADLEEDTEDDYRFESLEEVFSLLNKNPDQIAKLQNRVTLDDKTERLESTGWIGEHKRTIALILRGRKSRPQILHREEWTPQENHEADSKAL